MVMNHPNEPIQQDELIHFSQCGVNKGGDEEEKKGLNLLNNRTGHLKI